MSDAMRQVTIRGRVQGVGYRAWVDHQARRLDLQGWVRNRRDGSVEALFEGAEEVVVRMIGLCRQGPPSARVDDLVEKTVDADQLGLRQPGERFSVLPTV